MPVVAGLRADQVVHRDRLQVHAPVRDAGPQHTLGGLGPGDDDVRAPRVRLVPGQPRVAEHDIGRLGVHVVAEVAGVELERRVPPLPPDQSTRQLGDRRRARAPGAEPVASRARARVLDPEVHPRQVVRRDALLPGQRLGEARGLHVPADDAHEVPELAGEHIVLPHEEPHRLDEARDAHQGVSAAVAAQGGQYRREGGRVVGRLAAAEQLGGRLGDPVLEEPGPVRRRPHVHDGVDLAGVEQPGEEPARQAARAAPVHVGVVGEASGPGTAVHPDPAVAGQVLVERLGGHLVLVRRLVRERAHARRRSEQLRRDAARVRLVVPAPADLHGYRAAGAD